jgi:type II secretory ATPase GspE/PulE/Tfp pilus assembly ATPase PilB-like protein
MDFSYRDYLREEPAGIVAQQKRKDEGPVIPLARQILQQSFALGASDIHLEPGKEQMMVRCRVDGVLQQLLKVPRNLQDSLISRFKIMAAMDIGERRLPQDGRIQSQWEKRQIDIRVSSLPTLYGEKLVMRLLDQEKNNFSLDEMGFSAKNRKCLEHMIRQPYGLILITGPTGSGKTSTLYALMRTLQDPGKNIITVEDPIEYQMEGVSQVAVQPKIGLTFARCLRTILRQDPDLIMVGEIRDGQTAAMSVHAALTGHLVLSTLHTNTAVGAVSRLLDLGTDPHLLAAALRGVVAQRLVRKLCVKCRQAYRIDSEAWESKYFLNPGETQFTLYGAGKCEACRHSGYHGRTAIHEVLPFTESCRQAVSHGAGEWELTRLARKEGVPSLFQDGREKVRQGITSVRELLRVYGPFE